MKNNITHHIKQHLDSFDLDLRKTENARYIDQKCTPDILSSVAESIIEHVQISESDTFTIRDIWGSDFANDVMTSQFQKPSLDTPNAANEYDKVFSQPIKLFHSANILSAQGTSRPQKYIINDLDILQYIAISERKALLFIQTYLEKVLLDSGIYHWFDNFFENQDADSFNRLKDSYCQFIIDNTPINTEVEVRRIFTKIINPLAFKDSKLGTRQGRISNTPIAYQELFYNRVNFRDISKPKNVPRQTFLETIPESTSSETYQVEKAKRQVKRYHSPNSEIHRFQHIEAIHVHHIFPKHMFPELSDTFENLILITPDEHVSYAHPNGNTQRISKHYQLIALISKLDSIEESLSNSDDFYNLNSFKSVVNIGLDTEVLHSNMNIQATKNALAEFYVTSQ